MTFLGPKFSGIIMAWGVGIVYAMVTQSHPLRTARIFMIREIADFILFYSAAHVLNISSDRSYAKLYAVTNLAANGVMLALLLRAKLIGVVGAQIFIGLMVMETACKCFDFSKYRHVK